MKKQNCEKILCGFSLAEALITLLIVCLITLASVPVLTKKRRDVTDTGSGKWICTMNSQGQHVYWNSQISEQDITKPDTWMVSGDGTSCVFVPPMKAKNFAVTLIGGGGGGADGKSERTVHMDTASSESFNIPETGVYRVAVIGSGGGGMGSDDKDSPDNNRGIGGQGGSGGYYIGDMEFEKGQICTGSVANDSNLLRSGYDGGKGCNSWEYGPNSSWTEFKIGDIILVSAGTGSSGRATRNKGGKDPDCGDGGDGGSITYNIAFDNFNKKTYASSNGKSGRSNKNVRSGYPIDGNTQIKGSNWGNYYYGYKPAYHGVTIPASLWGDVDKGPYGWGGFGATANNHYGEAGNPGRIVVWQIMQKAGKGGSASELTTTPVPTIKGKVKVVVGKGGNANEDGQMTYAYFYNVQGKLEKTLNSGIGKAGSEGSAISENDETINGEVGQQSLWNNAGGGLGGKCEPAGVKPVPTTVKEVVVETDNEGNPICEVAFLDLGPVNKTGSGIKFACPLDSNTTPKGVCVGCDATSECRFSYYSSNPSQIYPITSYPRSQAYLNMINVLQSGDPINNKKFSTYTSLVSAIGGYSSSFKITSWDNTSTMYIRHNGSYSQPSITDSKIECLAYKTKIVERENITYQNMPASCETAGNGTYFGAGGGGGGATNTLNVKGEGGKGASGAVIIEW